MVANRADLRGFFANNDVAAVGALPDAVAVAGENETFLDVVEELAVTLFVFLLDGSHHLELPGDFGKALLAGFFSHAGVHVCPLEVFAISGIL